MENECSIEKKLHVRRAIDGRERRIIKREIWVLNFEPRWRERNSGRKDGEIAGFVCAREGAVAVIVSLGK